MSTCEMNEIDKYAEKRKKALEYLGENWVLHPNYKTNPRHHLDTGSITMKLKAFQTPRTIKETQQ